MRSEPTNFAQPGPLAVEHTTFSLGLPDFSGPHTYDLWRPLEAPAPSELVWFCHGFGGHRGQSSFLLKHVASHGFTVVAPDHHGLGLPALMALAMQAKARGEPVGPQLIFGELPRTRPRELLAMLGPVRAHLCEEHALTLIDGPCAVIGHSFGAYTALVAAARTTDIASVIALAPAGGEGPVKVPAFAEELALSALSRVPTLFVAAEYDTLIPVAGIERMSRACAGESALWLLEDADHVHFCDQVAQAQQFLRATTSMAEMRGVLKAAPRYEQLIDEASAHAAIRGLVAAELSLRLRGDGRAREFFAAPPSELPMRPLYRTRA